VGDKNDRRREGENFDRTAERIAPYQRPTDPTFTRMPGGAGDEQTLGTLEEKGAAFVHWDADTMDYCYNEPTYGECNNSRITPNNNQDMIAHALAKTEAFQGGIVLLHDGASRDRASRKGISRKFTADNLEDLIQTLQEEAYEFTNLDDEQTFPELNRYARALNPVTYARNDLMAELKEATDERLEFQDEIGTELRDTLPESVGFFSWAGDEVAEAKSRWMISAAVSESTQAFPANYYSALSYAIQAGFAFSLFRNGIAAQEAADNALK
jgi:hypothetical protein